MPSKETQRTGTVPRLPRGGEVAASALTELRRFHVGLPAEEVAALPEGLLPALLHEYRGAAVRGDYPVFVPPETAGAEALPLTLAELLERAMPAGDGANVLRDNVKRLVLRVGEELRRQPISEGKTKGGSRPTSPEPVEGRVSEAVKSAGAETAADCAASADAQTVLATAGEALRVELALPEDGDARLAASLAELVSAVPAGGRLVPWGAGAALELLRLAVRAHLLPARAAFVEEAAQVAAGLDAMLGSGRGEAEAVGTLGSRFVDAARLAGLSGAARGASRLDDERRQRREEARATLRRFVAAGAAPEPTLVRQAGGAGTLPPAPAAGWRVVASESPFDTAALLFDEAAEQLAGVLRAMRRARLELAGDYLPERHGPVLERLDWRAFTFAEMALLPPVAAVASGDHAANGGLRPLSRLLLSGRPVQSLVFVVPAANPGEGGDVVGFRFETASLGLGLREAFVQQSSIARPAHLAAGLSRALSCGRACLHVLDTPPVAVAEGAKAPVAPWLLAGAALEGRAHPLFLFDPGAGEGWARRLDFSRNPEPAADWPAGELVAAREGGGETTLELVFTFADYALLDPLWRPQLRAVPAGLEHEDLVSLAEWLALEPDVAGHRVPWIWAVDAAGVLHRLAVGRRLARACRDRRDFWRTLQEMAGVRSEYALRAADAARREAGESAAEELARHDAAHAAELERVHRAAAEEAVDRIVSALLEIDVSGLPSLDGGGAALLGGDVEQVTAALLAAVGPRPLAGDGEPTPEVAALSARLLSVLDDETLPA